jgi:hypothetical protein
MYLKYIFDEKIEEKKSRDSDKNGLSINVCLSKRQVKSPVSFAVRCRTRTRLLVLRVQTDWG